MNIKLIDMLAKEEKRERNEGSVEEGRKVQGEGVGEVGRGGTQGPGEPSRHCFLRSFLALLWLQARFKVVNIQLGNRIQNTNKLLSA